MRSRLRRFAIVLAAVAAVALLPACRVPPPTSRCGGPTGCTLADAGRAARVRVGLFPQDFGADSRRVIAEQANLIVNHGFSWRVMEPARGEWSFAQADPVDAFAREHRMRNLGMHFAWDQAGLDDFPDWVGAITEPDELRAVLAERARRIFERYPDLDGIDVVNEPLETFGGALFENHFYEVLGPDYVQELFTIVAAAAPPGTSLFVNENFVEYRRDKADGLVALVAELVRAGAPIDAVGLQMHLILGEPDWELLAEVISRIEALGVRVFVSELDVPVGAEVPDRHEVQAERYRRVVEACLASRTCDAVNIWGVDDGHTWLDALLGPGTDPLLYDRALEPKPAFFAVRDALLACRGRR